MIAHSQAIGYRHRGRIGLDGSFLSVDPPDFRYHFGVSYASEEAEVSRGLAAALADYGFSVFLDRDYQHILLGRRLSGGTSRNFW